MPLRIASLIALFCSAATAFAQTSQPMTQPGPDGWTRVPAGFRQVCVSSSIGNDTGDGSAQHPYRTIARAAAVVRNGDDLLLKRGDTFAGCFGNHKWRDVTVATWGRGPRPDVVCDTSNSCGLLILNGGDIRVLGLHLIAAHRDPSKSDFKLVKGNFGIYTMNCDNVLIEDCLIEFFSDGVAIQGNANKNFRLRRCIIRNCYSEGRGFSQGIFLDGQADPLIEDCVFDTCGWNPLLQAEWERRQNAEKGSGGAGDSGSGGVGDKGSGGPGDKATKTTQPASSVAPSPPRLVPASSPASVAPSPPHLVPEFSPASVAPSPSHPLALSSLQPLDGQPFPGTANMFNHGVYDHDGNGAGPSTVRNCIFVNCSASGMTQGPGGVIDNCLFIHNGMATDAWTGGPSGQITRCVCLGSKECPGWAGGGGLTLISKSGTVTDNIVAHGAPPQRGAALMLWANKGHEAEIPPDAHAAFQRNIVFDWPGDGFYVPTTRSHVEFVNNHLAQTPARIVDVTDGSDAEYLFESNAYEQSPQKFWFKSKQMDFDSFHQAVGAKQSQMMDAGTMKFPDSGRTIESYARTLSLPATLHDFVAAAEKQSRDAWNPKVTAAAVNDYIRAGFGLKPQ